MEHQNKKLYLIRGVSGAGKSTFARQFGDSHHEADSYFMKDGEYKFDPTKLKQAHESCRSEVELAMIHNHVTYGLDRSDIVVSNTFTQEWEMEPYYKLAETYGYTVFSVIVENRHGGVNQHGVTEDKLEAMRNRFEVKL